MSANLASQAGVGSHPGMAQPPLPQVQTHEQRPASAAGSLSGGSAGQSASKVPTSARKGWTLAAPGAHARAKA